jgi:YD repeat-containing protein
MLGMAFGAALTIVLSGYQSPPAESADIEALVHDLGSDDPAIRDQADHKLRKIGKGAEGALRRAAESSDVEVMRRARAILDWLRVLKLDERGRVIVERDPKGWNVEYSRDEAGNVIKKAWVNPNDAKPEYVRLYLFESPANRLVQEADAAGRRKEISYGPGGVVKSTCVEEGFVEESDLIAKMPPPGQSSRNPRTK